MIGILNAILISPIVTLRRNYNKFQNYIAGGGGGAGLIVKKKNC
jgi:hypothetical protein